MLINIGDKIKYYVEQVNENNEKLLPIIKTGIVTKKCKCLATQRKFFYIDQTNFSASIVYEDKIIEKN